MTVSCVHAWVLIGQDTQKVASNVKLGGFVYETRCQWACACGSFKTTTQRYDERPPAGIGLL